MNENLPAVAAMTGAELGALGKRELKQLRKKVRGIMRADLQRRAITGEPSPFKRFTQP